MRSRIDEHFAVAEKVVKRTRENPGVFEDEDILVLPAYPSNTSYG